eukprot:3025558-Prymnesium_polylepis.1
MRAAAADGSNGAPANAHAPYLEPSGKLKAPRPDSGSGGVSSSGSGSGSGSFPLGGISEADTGRTRAGRQRATSGETLG